MSSCRSCLVLLLLFALGQSAFAAAPAARPASPANPARPSGESAASTAPFTDYVLQPQDVIRVHVFQQEDINKQCEAINISYELTIQLPMIGVVDVRGKTARQLEQVIKTAYDKDYLVNPQVNVSVVKYADRSVSVMGNVGNAGRISFPPERKMTIIDAISAAGGATRYADLKKVTLTRKQANGEPEVRTLDVSAMMKPGATNAVVLEQDDVIYVPERVI